MNRKNNLLKSFEFDYLQDEDRWTAEEAGNIALDLFIDKVLSKKNGALKIIDLGGGKGEKAKKLQKLGHQVHVIDIVPLQEYWDANGINGTQMDVIQFRPTEKYSCAIDFGCLHHQTPENIPSYLASVKEMLSPGGWYFLALFHESPNEAVINYDEQKKRYCRDFTAEAATELLQASPLFLKNVAYCTIDRKVGLGKTLLIWGQINEHTETSTHS